MRLNIIFIFLLVFSTFSFGQTVENSISRPWNNDAWERTHLNYLFDSDTPIYLDIDYVMDELRLNDTKNLTISSADASRKISDAENSHYSAKVLAAMMFETIEETNNTTVDNFVDGCVGGAFVGGVGAAAVGSLFFGIGAAVTAPFGIVVGCVVGGAGSMFADIGSTYSIIHEELIEYNGEWKSCMNNAFDALELSLDEADTAYANAENTLNDINRTGICDDNYVWPPKSACENLTAAVLEVKNDAGKYNILYHYKEDFTDGIKEVVPNATLYYPMMELVWAENGIVPVFNELSEKGKDAKTDAKNIYNQYKADADLVKGTVESKFSNLENAKLEKITIGVALSDESDIGSIFQRFDTIGKEKENADKAYDRAVSMFSRTWEQSYLKYATINMSSAAQSYEFLEGRMDSLFEDAGDVVADAKAEAEYAISEAESRSLGSSGQLKLEDAKDYLSDGDNADALGDKYEYYVLAKKRAQEALGESSVIDDFEVDMKFSEVQSFIDRAKTDGIIITSFQDELNMLDGYKNLPDIMERLESLKGRIIGTAETVFSYLEGKREQLLENLRLAEQDDLIEEMYGYEQGIVVNGQIDYVNGLGRLKWLDSRYASIETDLESDFKSMNDIIANSIVSDPSLIIGKVKIDEPTDLSLNIILMNTRDVGGEDVEVSVTVPGKFQFDYFDITEGAEEVVGLTVQSSKLKITFDSFEPYEMKSVTFEKSEILARTVSEEQSAAGLGDGSARVEENIVFDLDVENAYIEVPEGSTDITVDSLSANRPLSKGVHTMSSSRIVDDAYDEERTDAEVSSTATETTVSYTITLTPYMDLDSVPVVVDVGNSEEITDVSISCIEYDYSVTGTKIDVYNIVSSATIQVSYTVSDMETYVAEELSSLASVEEPEIVAMVYEAQTLADTGDYQGALAKIEEIRKKMSELEKSKSKLVKTYSELLRDINREIKDLDTALDKADELNVTNSTYIDMFSSRKTELSGILAEMESIGSDSTVSELQDAVDTLEKIDKNWLKKQITAFKKDATKQLNTYRSGFVQFNNDTATQMLETLEHDINVLAAAENAESAVVVMADLEALEDMLTELEETYRINIEELRLDFELLKEDVEDVLSKYSSEAKSAKGTSLEQLFTVSDSYVTKLISDIEKNIENSAYAEKKIKDLEKMKKNMEDILDEAGKQAEGKLLSIKSVFYEKKDSMTEEDRDYISGEITQMEELIAAGNYGSAMKKGDAIVERINSSEGDGNFLFLLLASIIVLAMILVYMIRQQKKSKKPKIKLEKEE